MMSRVMNMASVVSTWLGGSCCVPIACRNSPSTTTIRTKLVRSEEHTSELQSRLHLVCRLLLEKKKYARKLKQTAAILDFVNVSPQHIWHGTRNLILSSYDATAGYDDHDILMEAASKH